eukprot:CFRG3589T1
MNETKFLFPIDTAGQFNHIVVFLTNPNGFPSGYGAAVHLNIEGAWQLLGYLSNEKPSAIFKVSSAQNNATNATPSAFAGFQSSSIVLAAQSSTIAQLGVSVEPLSELAQQTPATTSNALSNPTNLVVFTEKILTSFMNYAMSFSYTPEQMAQRPMEMYVPLAVVRQWFEKFQSKLHANPNFWKDL